MERKMDFFIFFRKYTGFFIFFYIILILFNLMWLPKTQVPHQWRLETIGTTPRVRVM
jgi:hypothetical protein